MKSAKPKIKITIYSTPICHYCVMLKEWLDEQKIRYTDYDVSEDQEKANEMIEISGQMGVPVTVVEINGEEQVLIGFDREAFKKILGV